MRTFIVLFFILFLSCNNQHAAKHEESAKQAKDTVAAAVKDLKTIAIDNKKDPVCEMPAKGNVNDTALYAGKVLGFCSTECKTEFLKNPKQYIAAAQISK